MKRPAAPRRLKVMLLTDEMEVGGTQRQIVAMAQHLDRAEFEPVVLYFRNPSFFVQELEDAGVRVIQVAKRGRIDLGFVWRLRQTLRRERLDVLHCFAFSGELWGAVARWLLPRAEQPALVSSVRGVYVWYRPWQWRVKRWVTQQSQQAIANSQMGAHYAAEQMRLPASTVQVTYNGVAAVQTDANVVRSVRRSLGLSQDHLMILFAGRLVGIKDVPTLLRALDRLHQRLPQLRLVLAGEGPERSALEQRVKTLGLSAAVQFVGQRGDVADLIAASDVVVLPSVREGLSNVILEAMMGARPVVASRAGGNTELITHQQHGLLFEIGDDAALAQALETLACDAPLRMRLGQQAQAHARAQFSIPAMALAYAKHYREAAV
jgi:glycosyltransferase involved in cell wall biosynthesis